MSPRIKFLEKYRPGGPWLLTAISTDRKYIKAKTFDSSTVDDAEAWIEEQNKTRNVYFTVNPTFHPMSKKAERVDIASVDWLHVDADVHKGEAHTTGLERIKGLMTTDCPTVPPTMVIFSGGGYQAFWKLSTPLELDGSLPAAIDAARYNQQLERQFKGDNCHNIDRLMRLPYTTNWPNAQKVAKGRTPVRAEVFSWDDSLVYDIEEFKKAPALQTEGLESNTIEINIHSVEKLGNVDELDKWNVPDRVKIIIVQGYDEDNPKPEIPGKDTNSRSTWMFDVCCQLVRCGVPDEVIFGVITDPKFHVSDSILDKGSNANKYATRQIQRAHDFVEEPLLAQLNDRFIVIGNMGGRCRVLEERFDSSLKRLELSPQSFQDFVNRYQNKYVEGNDGKLRQAGKWWLSHPKRRQADYMTFTTGAVPEGAYNLWRGFDVEPVPGDKHESYIEHILVNLCSNNSQFLNYLIGWMARAVQYPDKIGETAVVLRGKSGTGKSFFAEKFGKLFGRHYVMASDAKHIVGNFNAHLRDCVILFAEEAFYAGDKKHESVLKAMITSREKGIEGKFMDLEQKPNFVHLIMASNESWVVPTGPTERRFFVLDVNDSHMQDNDYFERIERDLDSGGYSNLLHFLLNYDLSKFSVYKIPVTQALIDQKMHSLDPMHEWWFGRLIDGALLSTQNEFSDEIPTGDLSNDYISNCAKFNVTKRGSEVKLGKFLQRVCPGDYPLRVRSTRGDRGYVYQFPSLVDLRSYWDVLFMSSTKWPQVDADGFTDDLPLENRKREDLPF